MSVIRGKNRQTTQVLRGLLVGVLLMATTPSGAMAAGLTMRADTVSTSRASTISNHTIAFTTGTTASLGSIALTFCTTATGACATPAGLDTTSATLASQSGIAGYTLVNTTNGAPYLVNNFTPNVASGTNVQVMLDSIMNPSAVNASFYVRIVTYTGTDGQTGAVDSGNVAVSTAQPVQLTGVTPEILVFCVGITIGSDCTTVSGNSIDFGDFSPTATRTGSSVMQAQTNAADGYTITINGTTLASGVNTIPALTTQSASTLGAGQFGLNLNISGGGTGAVDPNYDVGGLYRFNSGDVVASANIPTNANTYTSSYVVNIGGMQPAGVYTATMTYICTASF